MEHCVRVFGALLQSLDGFGGQQDLQFNFAPLGLLFDFFHHWKSAVRAGSDHEALTFPRYLLLNRSSTDNGVWPNCSRNCLEGFFLRLRIPHRSQRRARRCCCRSGWSRRRICRNAYAHSLALPSRAPYGCEGVEGATLLDVIAAAVRES